MGESNQSSQIRSLRFELTETTPSEGRESSDQEPGEEEDNEGNHVARIFDGEGVDGRDEEEVEAERREDRSEGSGPAFPDPGGEEDAQEQQQSDRRVCEPRKELQDPDRRQHEENGGRIADPSRAQGL